MKKWMLLMAGPGSLEDLRELWEPISQHFDGLVVTYHGKIEDAESIYLESNKKDGKIIYLPYSGRHDFSRNAYLYCGPVQQGDWCCQSDVLERPVSSFIERILGQIPNGRAYSDPNCLYYYGKPFIFQFHESMTYRGSPHESLIRQDGGMKSIELSDHIPDESLVRINVRPLKRIDPYNWVEHYARYMLMPWGSNHSLLGLEKNGDPGSLFPIRESKRLAFREEMRRRGFSLTLDGLKSMMSSEIDQTLKDLINSDKVWSDYYQYMILGNKDIKHSHDNKDMIKI